MSRLTSSAKAGADNFSSLGDILSTPTAFFGSIPFSTVLMYSELTGSNVKSCIRSFSVTDLILGWSL